jgi:hypothetical protein
MEMSGHLPALPTLHPGKNPSTHRVRSWMGPRVNLDVLEKGESLAPARIHTLEHPAHSVLTNQTTLSLPPNFFHV